MAENEEASQAPAKKSNLKIIIIGAVAVLLAIGLSVGATLYFLRDRYPDNTADGAQSGHDGKPAAAEHKAAKPEYTEVKQPFIVTLNANGATHYFQVFVAFMARDKGALAGLESRMPEVRNRLRLLFASQDFMTIQTSEGKKSLQKSALADVNKLLKQEKLSPIDQVLFTNFVLQ